MLVGMREWGFRTQRIIAYRLESIRSSARYTAMTNSSCFSSHRLRWSAMVYLAFPGLD